MKYTYKFLFVIIIGLQSCSPKLQPYSAEVNFIYKEATGTIAVKSTGYGNNQTDAVSDAQKNAFIVQPMERDYWSEGGSGNYVKTESEYRKITIFPIIPSVSYT